MQSVDYILNVLIHHLSLFFSLFFIVMFPYGSQNGDRTIYRPNQYTRHRVKLNETFMFFSKPEKEINVSLSLLLLLCLSIFLYYTTLSSIVVFIIVL